MRVLSVCSGIEAATVAWHPLGWTPTAFAEIERFPSAVLAHHYPDVPNLGDLTRYREWPDDLRPDLIVGGTPCQSFSVAGLRKGLDDPRGNLALVFLGLVDRYRPRWVVWENVPGVRSSGRGRDFGAFLGALGELGYGWAYRSLDAQYFGLAQRRERVFVVGCLGDWRPPAAVLLEPEGLRGDPPPRREAGEATSRGTVAGTLGRSHGNVRADAAWTGQLLPSGYGIDYEHNAHPLSDPTGPLLKGSPSGGGHPLPAALVLQRTDGALDTECGYGKATFQSVNAGHVVPAVMVPITARMFNALGARDVEEGAVIPILEAGARTGKSTDDPRAGIGIGQDGDPMFTLQSGKQHAVGYVSPVAPSLSASGPPFSRTGNERVEVDAVVAFAENQRGELRTSDIAAQLTSGGGKPGQGFPAALQAMAVRRLTPRECERLQGFPDDYTLIPWRKGLAPDGPRYKALGNSMAVPVMRWIGERIALVDALNGEVNDA